MKQQSIDRYCTGKVRHKTFGGAMVARTITMRKYPGNKFRVYQCENCGGYHIGRTNKRATTIHDILDSLKDKVV